MPKETKKMVIFIVEGKTDKTALEMIFRRLYSKQNICSIYKQDYLKKY